MGDNGQTARLSARKLLGWLRGGCLSLRAITLHINIRGFHATAGTLQRRWDGFYTLPNVPKSKIRGCNMCKQTCQYNIEYRSSLNHALRQALLSCLLSSSSGTVLQAA